MTTPTKATKPRHIHVGNVTIGNDRPLALIAGPCQIESRAHALEMAHGLVELTGKLGIGLIYKSSFDKANRSSIETPRGLGMRDGLKILAEVRERYGCPVLTDVHSAEQCAPTAEAVDVLQIPAFLCRQTDLLLAAAATGRAINIKKGQFLAPWDMKQVAAKVSQAGNDRILLCERGASFGYNTPFGAAARRAGQDERRPARIRPGAGTRRRRRRRRRRLHGDAPGPRSRAVGWAEHGEAEGSGGTARDADGVRPHRQGTSDIDCHICRGGVLLGPGAGQSRSPYK